MYHTIGPEGINASGWYGCTNIGNFPCNTYYWSSESAGSTYTVVLGHYVYFGHTLSGTMSDDESVENGYSARAIRAF